MPTDGRSPYHMHTTSNPYDRYLVPAGTYKNMVYEHSVVNLHELPYFFPTRYFEVHRLENHIPVGYRRSVGWGVNTFYLESFIDELAHAASKDPYQYRRELIARNATYPHRDDWLKALDMAAQMSGWGKPLPEGWARGISIDDRRRPTRSMVSLCAQVATVSVSRAGLLRLEQRRCRIRRGLLVRKPALGPKAD